LKGAGQTCPIKRWNNTLRQRLARFVRQTLSLSKSDRMHKICLALFIHDYKLALFIHDYKLALFIHDYKLALFIHDYKRVHKTNNTQ